MDRKAWVTIAAAALIAGCASTTTDTRVKNKQTVDVGNAKVEEGSTVGMAQGFKGGKIANSRSLITAQPAGDALNIEIPPEAVIAAFTSNPLAMKGSAPLKFGLPKTAYVVETVEMFTDQQIKANRLKVTGGSSLTINQQHQGTDTELSGNVSSTLENPNGKTTEKLIEKTVVYMNTGDPNMGQIAVPKTDVCATQEEAKSTAESLAEKVGGMYVIKVGVRDTSTGQKKEAYMMVPQRLLSK